MTKLNQIVAVVNGKKTQTKKELTDLYKKIQKPELFNGLVRTYRPLDEEGDTLPPEKTMVRSNVPECIKSAKHIFEDLIDLVYTQDTANSKAAGDLVVDGNILVEKVPVTHLMFLEKQLIDLKTFVDSLPVLDDAYTWTLDENKGTYVSEPEVKNRDTKSIEHRVVYEATEQHPAQVAEVAITKKVGEFTTIKTSGAIGVSQKREWLEKVEKLQEAVKFAREQANGLDVDQKKIANELLGYVFN